jgi:hypothetical protein
MDNNTLRDHDVQQLEADEAGMVSTLAMRGGGDRAGISQFNGVSWSHFKWQAKCQGRHLGYHTTEEAAARAYGKYLEDGRGFHSSTFQLNLSALQGIRGARKGCDARVNVVEGVKGDVWDV